MQQFKYVQTKSCTRKGLKCQFVRINYKKFKVNRKEKEMDDGDYRRALIQKATLHFSSHLRNHPQWCSGKVAKSRLTELRPTSFLSFFFVVFLVLFVCLFVLIYIFFSLLASFTFSLLLAFSLCFTRLCDSHISSLVIAMACHFRARISD